MIPAPILRKWAADNPRSALVVLAFGAAVWLAIAWIFIDDCRNPMHR
jgi:type II secretory pathway component PulM